MTGRGLSDRRAPERRSLANCPRLAGRPMNHSVLPQPATATVPHVLTSGSAPA